MKKYILLLFLILFSFHQAEAQKKSKRDYIKSLKIAFLTENLELTSEEAQQFWPIYNNFDESMYQDIYKEYRTIKHQLRDEDYKTITNAQAETILNKLESIEERKLELEGQLVKDLDGIISSRKILFLKKLENDFDHQLLDKLKREYHNKKEDN